MFLNLFFFFPLSTQFATFFCFLLLATGNPTAGTKRSATTSLRIYWWRILHIQSLCYFVVQFSARREIQIALNALNGNKWTPTPTTRVTCGHLHSPNKQQATEPPNRRQYTDLNGHCTGFTEKTHTISYLFTQIQQLSFFINIFFVSVLFVLHNDMAKPVCRSRRTAKMNNKEKKK